MIDLKQNGIFVQIGTKDGADEFNELVRKYNPSMIILVEPNTEHNNKIKLNYSGFMNIHIENVAITAKKSEMVILVHPKEPVEIYDSGKFSLLPMDDWGNDLIELKVKSMTFDQLCNKYGLTKINFLQIDTEGYDSEIIKSIDFDKIKIDVIKYEIWNFPADRFKRHGEIGQTYGTAGMEFVEKLLIENNYKLEKFNWDIIATHVVS